VKQNEGNFYILNNQNSGAENQRTVSVVRFSEISDKSGEDKKLNVYLDYEKVKGDPGKYLNVLIGVRPAELKTINASRNEAAYLVDTDPSTLDPADALKSTIAHNFSGVNLNLSFDKIEFYLDREQTYNDAPLFSSHEGLMNFSENSRNKFERQNVWYCTRPVNASREIVPELDPSKVGYSMPAEFTNADDCADRYYRFGHNLVPALTGQKSIDWRSVGYSIALPPSHFTGSFRGDTWIIANSQWSNGLTGGGKMTEVLSFLRTPFMDQSSWRVRLPAITAVLGARLEFKENPGNQFLYFTGNYSTYAGPTEIGIYRYDDWNQNADVDYDAVRDEMVLIAEYDATDFAPIQPLNGYEYDPINKFFRYTAYWDYIQRKALWLDIDPTEGDQGGDPSYFMTIGSKSGGTGFFNESVYASYIPATTWYIDVLYLHLNGLAYNKGRFPLAGSPELATRDDYGDLALQPATWLDIGQSR
jgi:hypothetical protein